MIGRFEEVHAGVSPCTKNKRENGFHPTDEGDLIVGGPRRTMQTTSTTRIKSNPVPMLRAKAK